MLVRQFMENHKPRQATNEAYMNQAITSKGKAKMLNPPVTKANPQISPNHTQPQRTIKTLPSHFPYRISSLSSGLVGSSSTVSLSLSPLLPPPAPPTPPPRNSTPPHL